ncbi:ChaN family lipoprotein [Thioalkalicoccus limnaeus]|uniref:ChaN family lipoprotein n=1 Tax=Thioalkalicoccus limnaeus TaxID=120681 RepID=A0ABV4BG43_9GAMM
MMVVSMAVPMVFACQIGAAPDPVLSSVGVGPDPMTRVVEVAAMPTLSTLVDRLVDRQVIFVGEAHDRYEDHLNQLAILRGLHARGKDLAIGAEFFQQPFQPALDAFIAGDISEEEMLRRTEYFVRWRFDYRLYRPILRFARDQGIPIIALNLDQELTQKVGQKGIAGLTDEERAQLPGDIDRGDDAYRDRLRAAFEAHSMLQDRDFEHFLEVQLLWDEGMASRAAGFLREHPEKTLVVLAGAGHVEYGHGIPDRLLRRLPVRAATLINGQRRELTEGLADYLLFPQRIELPRAGLLGVLLDDVPDKAGVRVSGFADDSGAKDAGIAERDRIVKVGDTLIEDYADIRIALIDRGPGHLVPVEVIRDRRRGDPERLQFDVTLR